MLSTSINEKNTFERVALEYLEPVFLWEEIQVSKTHFIVASSKSVAPGQNSYLVDFGVAPNQVNSARNLRAQLNESELCLILLTSSSLVGEVI